MPVAAPGCSAGAFILLPAHFLARSHLCAMPVHEASVAMVQSAAPLWQAAPILIQHEGQDGGRGAANLIGSIDHSFVVHTWIRPSSAN